MDPVSFLPVNFDPQARCVLLAGRGDYPRIFWEALQAACPQAVLFTFEEEAHGWAQRLAPEKHFEWDIGQVGHWLKALRQSGARYAWLAGQIQPKKLFQGLKLDLKAIRLLAGLKEKNATTIFGVLIQEIEALGISVLDARCFMGPHITPVGTLTRKRYTAIDEATLQQGIRVCRGIAELNIGQSIVVRGGTTILVEGFDGTDALIERAGSTGYSGMGLIKMAKPSQDFRYDVPVFGMHTLHALHHAGIQWAALEAHRSIILDQPAVLAEADRLRITLIGLKPYE